MGIKEVKCLLFLVVAFLLGGCATFIHGTTQDVAISTDPTGATAKVVVSQASKDRTELIREQSCLTPCTLDLKRKQKNYTLFIEKQGYESITVNFHRKISRAVFGNIGFLTLAPLGWAIDAGFGGQYKFVPKAVDVKMKMKENYKESSQEVTQTLPASITPKEKSEEPSGKPTEEKLKKNEI